MKCDGCKNEVARLWKHARFTEKFPDGLCVTCYQIEKDTWSHLGLIEERPATMNGEIAQPATTVVTQKKKTCRWCGAEKGPGICDKCGKDGRRYSVKSAGHETVEAETEEKPTMGRPRTAAKKTCVHCGAEKGYGRCKACGKDGRGGARNTADSKSEQSRPEQKPRDGLELLIEMRGECQAEYDAVEHELLRLKIKLQTFDEIASKWGLE